MLSYTVAVPDVAYDICFVIFYYVFILFFTVVYVFLFLFLVIFFFFLMIRRPPRSTRTDTLFPYTTLFRSAVRIEDMERDALLPQACDADLKGAASVDPGRLRQHPEIARAPIGLAARAIEPGGIVEQRAHGHARRGARSEEHTSELQSLMRISYAVFCMHKKTQKKTQ